MIALTALTSLFILRRENHNSMKAARIWIPFQALSAKDKIINPDNTATVFEYYLLENLASPLFQDSTEDPGGFKGLLVSRLSTISVHQIQLNIRPDLKWSDGSSISREDWDFFWRRLQNSKARHHVLLKYLKEWKWSSNDQVLLEFWKPIDSESLMQELSLADSAFVSQRNVDGDWTVTSGPYFIERFSFSQKRGALKKSQYHFLAQQRVNAPDQVEIIDDWREADVVLLNTPATNTKLPEIEALLSSKIDSSFSSILYVCWNSQNAVSSDVELRRQFANWVLSVQEKWTLQKDFHTENQMIPLGYSGRLKAVRKSEKSSLDRLRGKRLTIGVWKSVFGVDSIWKTLSEEASKASFELQVKPLEFGQRDPSVDLVFSSFRGNQKTSVGSWAFLMSDELSDLMREDNGIEALWGKFLNASGSAAREAALEEFHEAVLKEGYFVPLASTFSRLYFSQRFSAKRVNPFDLRLRFLDLE